MKTTKTTLILAYLILLLAFAGCKKDGTGGEATVATIAKHHERAIPHATIYIKYGAKDFPGSDVGSYNASQVTDRNGHTHFENLLKGNYYFYGVGYDSSAQTVVKGGVGLKIDRKNRKEETELIVPITE